MNYPETLDYLYSQLPMYQRQGKAAYKADLKSTWELMDVLEHPYRNFKTIHVGGTNGKGSTSHMLASILQEAGYKVGLYTSPHLKDFRERVRINGRMIPERDVVEFVEEYRRRFENIQLSFFEWTVGLAFEHFKNEQVDVAVIEVGMGGRLDSTNVIDPLVSIITNIGLDHTQFLGDTREKIAGEKAGIIKANTPVVIGEKSSDTQEVFEEVARNKNAPLIFAEDINLDTGIKTDLLGDYQESNKRTVLASIPQLQNEGLEISPEAIELGLKKVVANTNFMGRWQKLSDAPTVICDTAHNTEGLYYVLKQLESCDYQRLHIVLGMVNDKDFEDVLKLFPHEAQYYFCQAGIPRALDGSLLEEKGYELGLRGAFVGNVKKAVETALSEASENDLIFIGGSTFVVAEALELF